MVLIVQEIPSECAASAVQSVMPMAGCTAGARGRAREWRQTDRADLGHDNAVAIIHQVFQDRL
jgi:hypothetical protein